MTFKVQDHYFKKAKQDNYLARSAYKLEEIEKKYKIFSKGDAVMDLGYHPGSWVQYTAKQIGSAGVVVGVDLKPINTKLEGMPNVRLIQKDILEVQDVSELGVTDKFNVVISDMAPNTTGVRSVDQLRSLNLIEMVFHLLPDMLQEGGNFVIKVFDGNDMQMFLKEQRKRFKEFKYLKPKSTRSISKEFFVIGKGFKA